MTPTFRDAERLVARYLVHNDFRILALNFRRRGTEIDIIAMRKSLLLFVEVKYRIFTPPVIQELIPFRKQQAIMRGIDEFKMIFDCTEKDIRVDLALVTGNTYQQMKIRYQNHIFQVD